jgi:hypothetical protein
VGSQLQFMWCLHLNFYKHANKKTIDIYPFHGAMYFWLSVMLKLKLAANFNMTTKNYFVVDCIHNIVFIDFFLWMDEQEHFHLFYLYLHKYEIISQFTRLFFFFYLLIIMNHLSPKNPP